MRAAADGHLHAPHRHLPPPLPLLRGEGGAGGPRASHWRMVPKHISDVSRCSDWRVVYSETCLENLLRHYCKQ